MKKSYYAVIPANVRYDEKLPMGARMLYGELTALANEKGYCWATNSYFAELYNVTTTTISNWITKLEKQGHIHREIIYKKDSKEIEERRIYITPIKEDVPYKKIVQAYNDICKSLPSVKVISDKRKKKMRVTYREVRDLDIIIEAFRKAESSDFLSGRNGKWSGCNFDWLINFNNFIKVIEGTYDNKNGSQGGDDKSDNQNHSQNKYGW